MIGRPTGKVQNSNRCPYCGRFVARDIVCTGIVIKDSKILLVKRSIDPESGKWALPGGYLSWDETTEEGVIREIREETGIDVKIVKLLGVYSGPHRVKTEALQNVAIIYLTEPVSDKVASALDEVEKVDWVNLDSIPELAFDHNKMIEDYKKTL